MCLAKNGRPLCGLSVLSTCAARVSNDAMNWTHSFTFELNMKSSETRGSSQHLGTAGREDRSEDCAHIVHGMEEYVVVDCIHERSEHRFRTHPSSSILRNPHSQTGELTESQNEDKKWMETKYRKKNPTSCCSGSSTSKWIRLLLSVGWLWAQVGRKPFRGTHIQCAGSKYNEGNVFKSVSQLGQGLLLLSGPFWHTLASS